MTDAASACPTPVKSTVASATLGKRLARHLIVGRWTISASTTRSNAADSSATGTSDSTPEPRISAVRRCLQAPIPASTSSRVRAVCGAQALRWRFARDHSRTAPSR
ncbi:MAG: hypothetical protein C6Y20_14955 [Tagaea sp. CACIAM 22H2]|nr:hypothetical protein [Tagaea sp. CACIAM 22H2]